MTSPARTAEPASPSVSAVVARGASARSAPSVSSGEPTRSKTAIDSKDLDLAIELLDAIIKIKPDYIEAWNRRATIHYLRKEYAQSMEDIRQVLIREPRHFGAMSGLGMILQEFGDEKHALDVFRRALEINPHLPKIDEMIKSLTEKVEGRDI